MNRTTKTLASALILLLAFSSLSLLTAETANAQAPTAGPAPEFTVQVVSHPYDVPAKTTASTDPYTNKTTYTTVPGYHVENRTTVAVIKNNGAAYYNFRYKPHYSNDSWTWHPFVDSEYFVSDSYNVPNPASNSEQTIITIDFLSTSISVGGQIDIQVQGLFGSYRAVPYTHIEPLPAPTYDFYFNGTASDWSSTQTLTFNGTDYITTPLTELTATPTSTPNTDTAAPTPAVPEFSLITISILFAAVICAALMFRFRKIKRVAGYEN